MKKLFCIVISVLLTLALFIPAFAADERSTEMRFHKDGSFKILHLTDLHMQEEDNEKQRMSELLIERMVEKENPDICVITGDITMSGTAERIKRNVDTIMSVFDRLQIPVAITFGNHDVENEHYDPKELLSLYLAHESAVQFDCSDLPGCGVYNIPVLASDSHRTAFNLWVIDSGSGDGEGHYASTDKAIIDRYVEISNDLKEQNGGKPVNSLVFQHIIVPEIYNALKKTVMRPLAVEHLYNEGEYYTVDRDTLKDGRLLETPCPGYYNHGQFEAHQKQGDVLAMFFGHDHLNTFNICYKGIDLVNTPKAQVKDMSDCIKGGRVITLKESDTSSYETHVVPFHSLYSFGDSIKVKGDTEQAKFERGAIAKLLFYKSVYVPLDLLIQRFERLFR